MAWQPLAIAAKLHARIVVLIHTQPENHSRVERGHLKPIEGSGCYSLNTFRWSKWDTGKPYQNQQIGHLILSQRHDRKYISRNWFYSACWILSRNQSQDRKRDTLKLTVCYVVNSVPKVKSAPWTLFFFLIVFGGTEVPIILHFPLPPLRGQPTVKCHPRWQPISGLAVHCRLGRLLDSNPGLQFYNLVSLPMSHHCSLEQWPGIIYFY